MGLSGSLALYGLLGGLKCWLVIFWWRSYVNISGFLVFWLVKTYMRFEEDKEAMDMGYKFEEDNELVVWSASKG